MKFSINPSTLLGMLVAAGLIAMLLALTTHDASVYWNLPGLAIVLGGTLAATLLSFPLQEVLRVFRVFFIILRNEHTYVRENIEEIVNVSKQWFSGNVTAADKKIEHIKSPFLRMGLQLVIDKTPLEDIHDLMKWRMVRLRANETAEAHMFRTMAMFAPAFGMLGTLVGLINMLFAMKDNDFGFIAANLGIALITTFYGIILANLVFKPIAIKLERRTEHRIMLMNMVLEGITLLSKNRSPSYIRETLNSFMTRHNDEIHQ